MAKSHVTIVDIAEKAGVSAQTVSRVINNKTDVSDKTRRRIQQIIEELDYRPNRAARGLASDRNWVIGIVIPNITNPFFPEVTRGIEAVALEQNYNVLLYNTDNEEHRIRQALNLLEESRVDGVIVHAPTYMLSEDNLISLLRRQRTSVVIGRILHSDVAGVVRVDLQKGGRLATQHLLDRGFSHLAYVGNTRETEHRPERVAGFNLALAENHIPPENTLILDCEESAEQGFAILSHIIEHHPQVDAIMCSNDLVAIGALKACAENGIRVPEDIAIVGFDDILFTHYSTPSITTVRVPKYELGRQAAQLLFDRLNGHASPQEIILQPELIVRQSTG